MKKQMKKQINLDLTDMSWTDLIKVGCFMMNANAPLF
jgi:hypothetical protein